jgi:polyhydroxybutyrate depolymerase
MKNFRSRLLAILAVALLISSCNQTVVTSTATVVPTATPEPTPTPAPTIQPGDSTRKLNVSGTDRTYLLHIPPGLDSQQPVPVVLVFHEYTGSVSLTRLQTHFDDMADTNSFILAYPNGIGASWNAGDCCGFAVETKVDESAFVRQILSDLGTIASLDPKRIYAVGFSNGAMLAYRLACEMSDTFAAIGSVAGLLLYSPCQPQQPVSVIHIHGLNDPYLPYTGGASNPDCGSGCPATFPPVEQGIKTWVQLDGCTGSPQVNVDGALTHTIYATCKPGTAIELYTIDGLGHLWPQPTGSGKLNFPATKTIWDFFAAHPKP